MLNEFIYKILFMSVTIKAGLIPLRPSKSISILSGSLRCQEKNTSLPRKRSSLLSVRSVSGRSAMKSISEGNLQDGNQRITGRINGPEKRLLTPRKNGGFFSRGFKKELQSNGSKTLNSVVNCGIINKRRKESQLREIE